MEDDNDVIERIARKLDDRLVWEWDAVGQDVKMSICRDLARIAIEELRELAAGVQLAGKSDVVSSQTKEG